MEETTKPKKNPNLYRTNIIMPMDYKRAMTVVEQETLLKPSFQMRLALREYFEKHHADLLSPEFKHIWNR